MLERVFSNTATTCAVSAVAGGGIMSGSPDNEPRAAELERDGVNADDGCHYGSAVGIFLEEGVDMT